MRNEQLTANSLCAQEGVILRLLGTNADVMNELHKRIESLHEKLKPVISSRPSVAPEGCKSDPRKVESPVAEALVMRTNQLQVMIDLVTDLYESVQL